MPVLKLLGPVRGRNPERIPRKGGVLILANHRADVDPVVVQAFCPRHIYFMAKSELWDMRGLPPFLKFFRAFPVKRGEPDRAALKKAIDLLNAGNAVCVFPEGELSETGEMLPIKPGVALIARQARVPIVCCGLTNTARILPYGKLIPRPAFRSVWIRWGEPWLPDEKISSEAFCERVRAELLALTRPS
ncbi:MAG TPA: lysophospholipid acyltransferase family protein [Fimbriimonadaceae bacterium]|nr:lysophospholipid acyltransferase family protein [Fimbriimonadaceae bacterium]